MSCGDPLRSCFPSSGRNGTSGHLWFVAFATFFLLSNIKFLSVSFDLLVPIPVYELHHDHYNYTWGLYYSGDIEYFDPEHLPYGILAIIMLIVFSLFPTLPSFLLSIHSFFFRDSLICFGIFFIPSWTHSKVAIRMEQNRALVIIDGFLLSFFTIVWLVFLIYYSFTLLGTFFAVCAVALMMLALLILNLQPLFHDQCYICCSFDNGLYNDSWFISRCYPRPSLYHPYVFYYSDYWIVSSLIRSLHDILLVGFKEIVLM